MSIDRRNAWGFSLFCDDIRPEIGGKISIMGIYQADMVFPPNVDFPLTISKLCILIKYYEVPDSITDDLEIRVFVPGDAEDGPSIRMPLSRTMIEETRTKTSLLPLEADQERIHNMTFPITLSPFIIRQGGYLKVRIACGDSIINMGSLMLRKADPSENLTFAV